MREKNKISILQEGGYSPTKQQEDDVTHATGLGQNSTVKNDDFDRRSTRKTDHLPNTLFLPFSGVERQ